MRRCGTLILLLFMFSLMVFSSRKVFAGEISSAESKILAAVYEVYEYNGASYKALPEYTEQVRTYLQQDDVDLTEQDCNELLGMIDANLPAAIESGYFVKIDSSHTDTSTQQPGLDGQIEYTNGDKDTHYLDEPESEKDRKPEQKDDEEKQGKNKGDNKVSSDKDDTENEEEKREENDEKPYEETSLENGQPGTGNGNNAGSSSENNELENSDGDKENSVSSQDKVNKTSDLTFDDTEDVFTFWYEADAERRRNETNTIIIIVAIAVGVTFAFYAGKMIYRYYSLYLSHSKASSRWKPEHLSDMHCHLLPGVDDGSMNMNMTRKLLQMEIENGVDTILFTPHFKRGKSRFNHEKLFQVFEEVKQEALKMNPDMKLYLGEELYYDHSLCHAIEEGKALKLNGTDYVLVEFSPDVDYKTIHKACQNLVMLGVTPVLAHIERYPALISKEERLVEIHEMGVYYQMNITSIMGSCFFSRFYKQKKLMADGWIDIVGSDSHDDKNRNPKFKKVWKELLRLCDDEMIERIMWENPARLLSGKDMEL